MKPTGSLQRDSPVPLYYQLVQELIKEIEAGELPTGSPLPVEADLGSMYGLSRITVRQAMSELLTSGYVVRERPRGRLVVSAKKLQPNIDRLIGLYNDDVLGAGKSVHTEVLSAKEVDAGGVADQLLIERQEPVYSIQRVYRVEDAPIAFESAFLPKRLYPDLLSMDLSQSLLNLSESKYGLPFYQARQWINAVASGRHEARHLQVQVGSPLLSIRRVSFSHTGLALEYFSSFFRPDRYEFFLEITRGNS